MAAVVSKLLKGLGVLRSCCCSVAAKVLSSLRRMPVATLSPCRGWEFTELPEKGGWVTGIPGACACMPGLTERVPDPSYLQ